MTHEVMRDKINKTETTLLAFVDAKQNKNEYEEAMFKMKYNQTNDHDLLKTVRVEQLRHKQSLMEHAESLKKKIENS